MLIYLDDTDIEILKKFDRTNYYGFEEYQVLQKIIKQLKEQDLSRIAKLTCEGDA